MLLFALPHNTLGNKRDCKIEEFCFSDTSVRVLPVIVDSFKLDILPPSSGVQFYRDGIIFLSASKNEQKMLPTHISFGTPAVYYAVPGDSALGAHSLFYPTTSFSFPPEAISFGRDFNSMYFTKISKNSRKENIYFAEYKISGKKAGWISDMNPLNFCSDNSTYTHPALSTDGEMLIFASDKPGALGGLDLFASRLEGVLWSEPQNLGSTINTPSNELYPFLDSDNNLYFSSNGLPGFGGYDIFICKFNGKDWDKPVNLSRRINSENDEVAFTLNKANASLAFFTTKEKSDKSKMQLYRVRLNQENGGISADLSSLLYNLALLENEFPSADREKKGEDILAGLDSPSARSEDDHNQATNLIDEIKELPAKEAKTESLKVPLQSIADTANSHNKVSIVPISADSVKAKPEKVTDTVTRVITPIVEEMKNDVLYRIQFASSTSSKGSYSVTVGGKSYKTWEYLYKGAYRATVGEFTSLSEAKSFQTKCRQSGYPQAFVVVMVNDVRSLDPAYFK